MARFSLACLFDIRLLAGSEAYDAAREDVSGAKAVSRPCANASPTPAAPRRRQTRPDRPPAPPCARISALKASSAAPRCKRQNRRAASRLSNVVPGEAAGFAGAGFIKQFYSASHHIVRRNKNG
ncbi:MAG: hypothetical protein LBI92_06085 [Azoarcus sp.]|jgi:hypothetical protein|nr:hypothetical protein [Azoarcus sp.]